MKLKDKKVVVIGGSSGIGLGVAKLSHAEGAEVIIASRNRERGEQAARGIDASVGFIQLDVTDYECLPGFFESLGSLDHLVCTSHGTAADVVPGVFRDIVDLDIAASREFMEAKFWGPMMASRYAYPYINQGGSITLTSGSASRTWLEKHGIMGPVNCAVEGFVKKAAHEFGPIRVNAVVPSLTDTPAFDSLSAEDRQAYFDHFAGLLPVREVASCADIAEAYLFAMTARQLSGAWVDVDGGNNVW